MKVFLVILSCFIAASFAISWPKNIVNYNWDSPEEYLETRERYQSARIIGGQKASLGEFPWQIALFFHINGTNFVFCGGSLISSKYVLTAAHCAEEFNDWLLVILGAQNIYQNEPTQVRMNITNMNNIKIHGEWDSSSLANDIAVIKLPEEVTENEYIKRVKLPSFSERNNLFEYEISIISGWGRTSDTSSISSELMWVKTNIIENLFCSFYYLFLSVRNSNICTNGIIRKGSCSGDSGGPVVVDKDTDPIIIGLVSFGFSASCEIGWPSVHTRITIYLDWIQENTDVVIQN